MLFRSSNILDKILLAKGKNLRLIILYNYASEQLFPKHYTWVNEFITILGSDWDEYVFDDKHWHGNGTKILVKNNPAYKCGILVAQE